MLSLDEVFACGLTHTSAGMHCGFLESEPHVPHVTVSTRRTAQGVRVLRVDWEQATRGVAATVARLSARGAPR